MAIIPPSADLYIIVNGIIVDKRIDTRNVSLILLFVKHETVFHLAVAKIQYNVL